MTPDELHYQDEPADIGKVLREAGHIMEWTYEAKESGMRWVARQLLNGQVIKSQPCQTEAEARARCRAWEEARSRPR